MGSGSGNAFSNMLKAPLVMLGGHRGAGGTDPASASQAANIEKQLGQKIISGPADNFAASKASQLGLLQMGLASTMKVPGISPTTLNTPSLLGGDITKGKAKLGQ